MLRAHELHGKECERDADDDRTAAVRAELVLGDRRERERCGAEEREPAEAAHQQSAAEERGIEKPRLEQVRDTEEAARQLGADRRQRKRRRADEHRRRVGAEERDEREPECRLVPEELRPEVPPATVQSPRSVTRGAASPAGNQPCTRLTPIAVPNAMGAPRGNSRAKKTSSAMTSTEPGIVVPRAISIWRSSRYDVATGPPSFCQSSACRVWSAVRRRRRSRRVRARASGSR